MLKLFIQLLVFKDLMYLLELPIFILIMDHHNQDAHYLIFLRYVIIVVLMNILLNLYCPISIGFWSEECCGFQDIENENCFPNGIFVKMGRDFSKIPNGIYYLETNDRKFFAKGRVYRRKYQSDFPIHRVKKIIDRPFKRIFKIINQKASTPL